MALQSLDSDGVAVGERSDVVCCGLYLCTRFIPNRADSIFQTVIS